MSAIVIAIMNYTECKRKCVFLYAESSVVLFNKMARCEEKWTNDVRAETIQMCDT